MTSSARNRPVLAACGIDVVLPLQEFKLALVAYGVLYPGFLALVHTLCRSRVTEERRWRQTPQFYQASRYCLHQMSAACDDECRPSLRRLTFPAAVRALFRQSRGQVVVVAVKRSGRVIINPRAARAGAGGELVVGACESLFVVAPSWEVAWAAMTEEEGEEDEEDDENNVDSGGGGVWPAGFDLQRSRNAVRPRHPPERHQQPPTAPPAVQTGEEEKDAPASAPRREVFMTTTSGADNAAAAAPGDGEGSTAGVGDAVKVRRLDSWVASVVRGNSGRSLVPLCAPAATAGATLPARMSSGISGTSGRAAPRSAPALPSATAPIRTPGAAPSGRQCAGPPPLHGHLVVVLSSSGRADTLPASALMLPVVFFLKVGVT